MNIQTIAEFQTHSIEAEQSLIGAIFVNNDAIQLVSDFLKPDHFFEPIHAEIYRVCLDLARAGRAATPVTLRAFLNADTKIESMTLGQYLARLMSEATTIVNAVDYGRLILDHADRRKIRSIGQFLCDTQQPDVVALAAQGIDALDEIATERGETNSPALTMPQATARAVDAMAGAYQRDGKITGISWGLRDLDNKTLGLQKGELVIGASRPGMGKTTLGLNVLRSAARSGVKGALISLEMGDISVTQRMIADQIFSRKPISYWQMRSGRFSEVDFEIIADGARAIGLLPIKIEQQAGLTLSQIGARARQLKRKGALDLLVVDHLHLIRPSGRYAGNRVNELGETSSGLKALAKDLDIAVLALCQLSRAVESREDRRPNMGDLRGSGDIEQDADTVVMLYREAYYLDRSKPNESDGDKFAQWLAKCEAAKNKLEAIIEKQRNGPIGTVELFCEISCNAVRDRDRRDPQEQADNQGGLGI